MNNKLPKDLFEGVSSEYLMSSIGEVLATRDQLTVNSNQLSVSSKLSVDKLLTDKEINYCLSTTQDLQNPQFEAWYRLRLYKLGVNEFMERAEKARKFARDKPAYFSSLLKKQ